MQRWENWPETCICRGIRPASRSNIDSLLTGEHCLYKILESIHSWLSSQLIYYFSVWVRNSSNLEHFPEQCQECQAACSVSRMSTILFGRAHHACYSSTIFAIHLTMLLGEMATARDGRFYARSARRTLTPWGVTTAIRRSREKCWRRYSQCIPVRYASGRQWARPPRPCHQGRDVNTTSHWEVRTPSQAYRHRLVFRSYPRSRIRCSSMLYPQRKRLERSHIKAGKDWGWLNSILREQGLCGEGCLGSRERQ